MQVAACFAVVSDRSPGGERVGLRERMVQMSILVLVQVQLGSAALARPYESARSRRSSGFSSAEEGAVEVRKLMQEGWEDGVHLLRLQSRSEEGWRFRAP